MARRLDHDGCIVIIVSIGPLVFFSTEAENAWILEPADVLACRLAVGGDPTEIFFEETETGYAVGSRGHYRIERELFAYEDRASHRRIAASPSPDIGYTSCGGSSTRRNARSRHGPAFQISNLFG